MPPISPITFIRRSSYQPAGFGESLAIAGGRGRGRAYLRGRSRRNDMRVAWAAAAVLMGGAVTAAAEDVPRAWTIAAEPAGGRIHEDDEAPAGSLRVFRRLGRSGALRAQLGLTLSSYGALDAGVEWRTCPSCRVS